MELQVYISNGLFFLCIILILLIIRVYFRTLITAKQGKAKLSKLKNKVKRETYFMNENTYRLMCFDDCYVYFLKKLFLISNQILLLQKGIFGFKE